MISPWIPLIIGAVCAVIMSLYIFGTWYRYPVKPQTPRVAVVVCARDEEKLLMQCLMSLASQDYPDDKLKLILVDHLSKDSTGEIMDRYAATMPFQTEVIHITEIDPVLKGKTQALAAGINRVEDEEYILLTDADCVVPERWVRTLVARFTKNVVAVGGIVSIDSESEGKSDWLTRVQDIDFRYYYGFAFGLTGITAKLARDRKSDEPGFSKKWKLIRPAFVSGNNLAMRTSAYREMGGFERVAKSLIEDYDLLVKMLHETGGLLAFTIHPDARVLTRAQPTVRALWRQRYRWATSTNVFHLYSYFLFAIIFLTRVVLPLMLFVQPCGALGGLLLYSLVPAAMVIRVSHLLDLKWRFRDMLILEIYQILLHTTQVPASLIRWPVIWKGVNYNKFKPQK